VSEVLQSVLDTEIAPELVPSGEEEELQSSEANVGSFALQDFSLFQVLRYGFRPPKIAFLAWHAWSDSDQGNWPPGFPDKKRPSYSPNEIRHWLQVFVQRFYSFRQFKRPRCPTGPRCRTAVFEQDVHRPLPGRILGDFDVASRGRRPQLMEVVERLLSVCVRPFRDRVVHGVVGANVSPQY
jgi:hypothetical protein